MIKPLESGFLMIEPERASESDFTGSGDQDREPNVLCMANGRDSDPQCMANGRDSDPCGVTDRRHEPVKRKTACRQTKESRHKMSA